MTEISIQDKARVLLKISINRVKFILNILTNKREPGGFGFGFDEGVMPQIILSLLLNFASLF